MYSGSMATSSTPRTMTSRSSHKTSQQCSSSVLSSARALAPKVFPSAGSRTVQTDGRKSRSSLQVSAVANPVSPEKTQRITNLDDPLDMARFPRVELGHMNTPLEHLPRLSEALGGPEIWIKRDDCTGVASGGNKVRKLEFLMAEAKEAGADIVLTQGATQSNHARQTAAFAAKMGMDCHILLEDRTGKTELNYRENGNVLLDRLMGASIEHRGPGLNMNDEMEAVADKFRAEGRNAFTIVGGGSDATGALGYVNCAQELVLQAGKMGLQVDHLVHATGSAGTQSGLVTGLKALDSDINLLGIGVRMPQDIQEGNVYKLAVATAEKLGLSGLVEREDVVANCDYIGPGYGLPAGDTLKAIEMFAQLEGILLDPVYSGKGAAGLIDLCRKGHFKKGENVVFLHTGGSVSLMGYLDSWVQE